MANSPDALNQLAWLIEAGADEAVTETARDHFVVRATVPPPRPAAPPVQTRSFVPPPPPSARPLPPSPAASPIAPDAIGNAQAAAASAKNLDELRAAMEAFDAGALKKGANKMVFADGNPGSGILLIGEAPGQEEDRLGLPFVGRAGKLLDLMLAAINMTREHVYITNVINWRPPGNRNPTPEEAAMCLPFLRRHIELAKPQVMMVLGSVALTHVMGRNDGIMKSRGRWMEYNVAGQMVPVMPTLHPAYLLRQPAHKKLAWRDLQALEQKIASLPIPKIASS